MNSIALIRERLQTLAPLSLDIEDESDDHIGHREANTGAHLKVRIVADCFAALSPLARHRLVYRTVGQLTALRVHALSIEAKTPHE